MTESYIKKLIELSEELEEQLEAEREDNIEAIPFLLVDKIKYLNGYIQALSLIKLNKK